jgi:hypothetical protein
VKKYLTHLQKNLIHSSRYLPVVGVVLLIGSLFFVLSFTMRVQNVGAPEVSVTQPLSAETLAVLRELTIPVPDQEIAVRLLGGVATFDVAPDSATKGFVTLLDGAIEYGAPTGSYALVPIAVSGGGSGMFNYVLLFKKESETLRFIDSAYLGDRVEVDLLNIKRSLNTDELYLTAKIKTREESEAMAAPRTQKQTLRFIFRDGTIFPWDKRYFAPEEPVAEPQPM